MIFAADLGTSSLKAGLLSLEGRLEHHVRIPYPNPTGLNHMEFNPLQWEWAFHKALRDFPPVKITAISLSGNGPTLVPCDEAGKPLTPALLWLQDKNLRIEGQDSYYLPEAAWFKADSSEEIWKKTRWFFSPPEWLQFRLTGKPTKTIPHDSFKRFVWDSRQISTYSVDPRLFPELVYMGTNAGTITEEAGSRSGLAEGTVVAAAGSDFMSALLGSGTVEVGRVCDRAGTSEGINYCSPVPSNDSRLRDLPHLVEGLWNSAAILSSTGLVFEWYRHLTGQKNRPYEDTLAEVDRVPPGRDSPLFFPGHQGGTLWAFDGGSFHRLQPGHGFAEMGRAVMEAIGYGVRRGIEYLEDAGMKVEELRVTGGQARGDVWNQMKADITGRRLLIPMIEDAELAGCAACALVALGLADNLMEGADRFVRIKKVVEPRMEVSRLYEHSFSRYQEASKELLIRSTESLT